MNDHVSQGLWELSDTSSRDDLDSLEQPLHSHSTHSPEFDDPILADSPLQQTALPYDLHVATPQDFSNSGIDPRHAPPQTPSLQYQPQSTHVAGYLGAASLSQLPANSPPDPWPVMAYNAHQQLPLNDSSDSHAYKASPSPEAADNHGALGKPHRRGYQACQNCRSRKVKCDLGSE